MSLKKINVKMMNAHNDMKPKSNDEQRFFVRKFFEFCKRTDLHGFKYIVMEKLNKYERGCWAFAVFLSIICAAYFVITAYRWYARNPIVTVIESTQGAIWDVPFPAVTICNLNIISRKAAYFLAKNLSLPSNVSEEFVFKTLRYTPLLHSSNIISPEQKRDLHLLQDVLDFNSISIESLFHRLSPASSCNEIVERCMWKNTLYRCEQLFQQIFTSFNLCCTFNYYAVDVPEGGRKSELIYMPTPRRVASCGYQTALTVLIRSNSEDYYSTIVASQGSLVFIDNAYNIPDLDSPVRLATSLMEVLIGVSPERTYTTAGIKSFSPEERQCYYHDEVKIGDFRQYSYHNCMALQRVEIIRNVCNCIPFYFPLRNKDFSHTCNFHDLECLENILKPIEDLRIREKYAEPYFKCLPECEHYDYPLEVALGRLAMGVPLRGQPFFNNIDLTNRSVLNVFFNDLVSTRYRRDVYLNWQNILAAFGGLLSLMLGFTLITGFDLLLFITFRVFYDLITTSVSPNVKQARSTRMLTKNSILQVEEMHKKFTQKNYRRNDKSIKESPNRLTKY